MLTSYRMHDRVGRLLTGRPLGITPTRRSNEVAQKRRSLHCILGAIITCAAIGCAEPAAQPKKPAMCVPEEERSLPKEPARTVPGGLANSRTLVGHDAVIKDLLEAGAIVDMNAFSKGDLNRKFTMIEFDGQVLDEKVLSLLGEVPKLEYISFSACAFEPRALRGLVRIGHPLPVEFKKCRLPRGALGDLDGTASIGKLRFLDMPDLDDNSMSGLTVLPNLQSFTALGRGLTAGGLRFLASCPLTEIVLWYPTLDDAALDELVDKHDLVVLGLGDTEITDEATRTISRLKRLKWLFLPRCHIGDSGVERLGALTNLTLLNLDGTRITDEGVRHLSKLVNLETLGLAETAVTIDGLKHLAKLSRLRALGNRGARFSGDDAAKVFGRYLTTN